MRRTIAILIVILVLIAVGFFFVRQRRSNQEQAFEILREAVVEKGTIAATVGATGSIEPEALVTLGFGVGGNIEQVNVIRGQQVAVGDVLATLETDELGLTVQQAEDAVRIQELTLQQAMNVRPSQATLDSAQADIDASEGNLIIAQANLAAAEAAVDQAQAQKGQLLRGSTPGQIAAAESQLSAARLQQKQAQDAHDKTLTCVDVPSPTGEDREVCPALGPAEELARANLENANAALSAAEAQLADLRTGPGAADIQAADAAIAAANAQVESAKGNVLVAESNLARAQAAYERLLEGPTEDEIAILQAQVDSAKTNLALAQLRLEQAMIIAPINARVASVTIREGEQGAPGAPAITLVNEDAFHIEVSVDEIDIDQIDIGQEVDIALDALSETIVTGTIADIAPTAATSGGGVVTYLVTINIDGEGIPLRPGMTANASIVIEEIDDVLRVPNWAIRLDRETGEAFVNRLTADGALEEVLVETGLRNEQFSEILSGLNEGDKVIVTNEREGLSSFFGG